MIAGILCNLVNIYVWILIGRVILSFVMLFRPDWRPPDWMQPVLEFVYLVTDPPVNLLRRYIPPLRAGAMAIDLAFLVWFLIVRYVIASAVCTLGGF